MRTKLYLQIYLAFVGVVVISILVAMLVARLLWEREQDTPPQLSAAAELLVQDLPRGPGLSPALRARAQRLSADLSLWSADGKLLATTNPSQEPPTFDESEAFQPFRHGHGGMHIRLPDGRWLSASMRHMHPRGRGRMSFALVGVLLVGSMALATFPVARRITRRLEELESAVDRFGQGDWKSRVPVQGQDEIADLARAFNLAADRIDALLAQHKRVLASASHELRAPLARLRMAFELLLEPPEGLPDTKRRQLLAECEADIGELDALVYDVLLAARLERPDVARQFEAVDLDALVRREAERAGARAEVSPLAGSGDPRMLRRLLQNLLDNAKKYGGGTAIEVELARTADGALIAVRDHGPGVPPAERERIFEPFYRPAGHREGRDGGVGLGLSLVRQIAEHHGGSARCQPAEGGGSRFEVTLPGFT
jgi:signal transduction histidine kinase